MVPKETEDKVIELLVEICNDEVVCAERDIDLFDAGLLDSMAFIELLVGMEDALGIELPPTSVERDDMNTTNKILSQIEQFLQ